METIPCLLCKSNNLKLWIKTKAMMMDRAGDAFYNFVQCKDCNFIFLNPRVDSTAIHSFYPAYYLPYQSSNVWGKYAWLAEIGKKQELKRRLSRVLNHASNTNTKVLDVGCGKPDFILALKEKLNWQVKGIDFDESSWTDSKYISLDLAAGDIGTMDFSSFGQFDLITMWHYLEHDYNPSHILTKLKQNAHPQTRLIVEVPNCNSLTRRIQKQYWQGFHTPRHLSVFDQSSLKKMLERNGWNITHHYCYGSLDPFVLWWLGERERKGLKWDISFESEFAGFMIQKLISFPIFAMQRFLSLGVQTIVAVPA